MSWPEIPQERSIDAWKDVAVRRGRHIKRVRRTVIAATATSLAVAGMFVVPTVLGAVQSAHVDKLSTVTPDNRQRHDSTHTDQRMEPLRPRRVATPPIPSIGAAADALPSPALSATSPTTVRVGSVPSAGNVATRHPSVTTAPFAMFRSLQCPRSHYDNASCAGSAVHLDPQIGEVDSHAHVQTGSGGNAVDYYANDTASGVLVTRVWLPKAVQTARVSVEYRLPKAPTTATSAGNTASNDLDVVTHTASCPDCAGSTSIALAGGAATNQRDLITVDVTNTNGGLVPAGWITVKVYTVSFATIGVCSGPCGEPGTGTADATASTVVDRVSVTAAI